MLGLLRNPRAVVAVNVTVHEQLWPVLLEQLVEAVKAAVGDGVKVVQVPRGTVGDEKWILGQSLKIRLFISRSVYMY